MAVFFREHCPLLAEIRHDVDSAWKQTLLHEPRAAQSDLEYQTVKLSHNSLFLFIYLFLSQLLIVSVKKYFLITFTRTIYEL